MANLPVDKGSLEAVEHTTRVIAGCFPGDAKLPLETDTGFGVRFKIISPFELVPAEPVAITGPVVCEFKLT